MFSEQQTGRRIVLTVEEAAEQLGIGRTLMYALVKSGEVESVSIGRLRRIPNDALHSYVDRMRGIMSNAAGKVA
ncbi:excisionase family DNA-binding protein [Fodinicola acaciae]|uniref:excisionase family DNA-binding protein n=1 Tax=Fodinicola acaciae TaxID=2681555 RepID=UPI0013D41437|nr:excisionase family DNA-binding protein [Fodinicola acaciae]